MKSIAKKIIDLRLALGLKQAELGAKIGVPQSTVSKWERELQRPDFENITKLAALADMSPEQFVGIGAPTGNPINGRRIKVMGELAAGSFREAIEYAEDEQYDVSVMLPDDMAGLPLQGFVIKGPSMDKYYPDGSIVYVAPIHSLPSAPQSGDRVMVMRRDKHGMTEATVKEYEVDSDGKKWLWPRSSHPEHQAPVNYMGKKRGDVEEVAITGVVMAALVFARR